MPRKRQDLTGRKFGRLTVIEFDHSNHGAYWKCECDCGNEIIVVASSLLNGSTQSCGCLNKERIHKSNFKDITGKRFGNLVVVRKSDKKVKGVRSTFWECKCDCGNTTIVNISKLTSGHTKSCGCLRNVSRIGTNYVPLEGKRFGKLVVQRCVGFKSHHGAQWLCICDCGNTTIVDGTKLMQGATKSCGCGVGQNFRDNLVDLTGQKFGKLLALYYNIELGKWHCKCDCGNECDVFSGSLKSGATKSCGCLSLGINGSENELEIKSFIQNIIPNTEITKERVLDGKEIDIYIPLLKIGIEYNGSAFHATKNGVFTNKNKYYHRDKFLSARKKGIHLITVFDIDYEDNKWQVLSRIRHILAGNKIFFIPSNEIEYTNNDYDIGTWMYEYGYKEIGQEEPSSFIYKDKYLVYRCGRTIWKKI